MLKALIIAEMKKQGIGTDDASRMEKFAAALASAIDQYLDIQVPLWFAAEIPKVADISGTPPSPTHLYTP